jgi:hypothetical protein
VPVVQWLPCERTQKTGSEGVAPSLGAQALRERAVSASREAEEDTSSHATLNQLDRVLIRVERRAHGVVIGVQDEGRNGDPVRCTAAGSHAGQSVLLDVAVKGRVVTPTPMGLLCLRNEAKASATTPSDACPHGDAKGDAAIMKLCMSVAAAIR